MSFRDTSYDMTLLNASLKTTYSSNPLIPLRVARVDSGRFTLALLVQTQCP
jgi:hypothetical protein